jgi:hypothetical protein
MRRSCEPGKHIWRQEYRVNAVASVYKCERCGKQEIEP